MANAAPTLGNFPGMRQRMSFNIRDWYWRVAGVESRYYSSRAGASVAADDATLASWLEQGGRITSIKDVAELNDVLIPRGQPAVPADDALVQLATDAQAAAAAPAPAAPAA